jgi:hypothetical protein
MARRCFPMGKPDYERITELVKRYHRKGHVTTAWWEEMWKGASIAGALFWSRAPPQPKIMRRRGISAAPPSSNSCCAMPWRARLKRAQRRPKPGTQGGGRLRSGSPPGERPTEREGE